MPCKGVSTNWWRTWKSNSLTRRRRQRTPELPQQGSNSNDIFLRVKGEPGDIAAGADCQTGNAEKSPFVSIWAALCQHLSHDPTTQASVCTTFMVKTLSFSLAQNLALDLLNSMVRSLPNSEDQ